MKKCERCCQFIQNDSIIAPDGETIHPECLFDHERERVIA